MKKLAENIIMLAVDSDYGLFHPVLIWDDNHLGLIDLGWPDQSAPLFRAIEEAGFRPQDITDAFITHQDLDHFGNVNELLDLSPNLRLWLHEVEAPYLDGSKIPVKLAEKLEKFDAFTDEEKAEARHMESEYKKRILPKSHVNTVSESTVLPMCGGIKFILVPGHTPGAMVVYLQESGIAICGDSLNIHNGQITGPDPRYSQDMEVGMQSVEKMKAHGMKGMVAYHGGYLKLV